MSEGLSSGGAGKRKVPKVFSKEAITKFRAWLFQNLTVTPFAWLEIFFFFPFKKVINFVFKVF